jgi:hypothetical protein
MMTIVGYIGYIYVPATPRVEELPTIMVNSAKISIFIWVHMIQTMLSAVLFCLFIYIWSGESLVLKTPFKSEMNLKYSYGPTWETELIGSWIFGIGIYCGFIIILPSATTSIYLFGSSISALFLLFICFIGPNSKEQSKLHSKNLIFIFNGARLSRAISLKNYIGAEKVYKIIWMIFEWILFAGMITAYGFAFFQIFKMHPEFTRLLFFLSHIAVAGFLVMILSLNLTFNEMFKRGGLIFGAIGMFIYYSNIEMGFYPQSFDIGFGLCFFSLLWGYLSRIFKTPMVKASGFISLAFLVMGYTLLIPAYLREVIALVPFIRIFATIVIGFEIISIFFRDLVVPTAWQIDDRLNHTSDQIFKASEVGVRKESKIEETKEEKP